MGYELDCRMKYGGKSLEGRASLETDFLLFRGEQRIKILLKEITSTAVSGDWLHLHFPGGPAAFHLGSAAEKWADKILHPPSLLDKLGIKPGMDVAAVGRLDGCFTKQVDARTKGPADLVLLAAENAADLKRVPGLISRLKPRGVIWIIYPKGQTRLREAEVLEAGRAAGLKDTKVARFSDTHTALRFSQPVQKS